MTPERHQARHAELQDAFLELWYDFARHWAGVLPQEVTVGQLMTWSHAQTQNPTDDGRPPVHAYAVCAHCGDAILDPLVHQCQTAKIGRPTP